MTVSLDTLVTDPFEVLKLSPSAARETLLKCAALVTALAGIADNKPGGGDDSYRLTVEEASALSGMSTKWLYANWDEYGLGTKRGRKVLFSEQRLKRREWVPRSR